MPAARNFQHYAFDKHRIVRGGKFVGRESYWKLYAIENLVRVIIHSILTVQISANWWNIAVDPNVQRDAGRRQRQYARRRTGTDPGGHGIYYVFLAELNNIIRANSNLFLPIVPDIDEWVARLERVRPPRNVVGHMNFPNWHDRKRISAVLEEFVGLVMRLQESGITLEVP